MASEGSYDVINSASDMQKWMAEHKEDGLLIDVLPEPSYKYQHLPTARSADFYGDGFLAKLADWASSLKGKETPVCVYCSDAGCPTSGTAANALAEAGWTNVAKFKGGLAEWDSADLDFEGDIEDE